MNKLQELHERNPLCVCGHRYQRHSEGDQGPCRHEEFSSEVCVCKFFVEAIKTKKEAIADVESVKIKKVFGGDLSMKRVEGGLSVYVKNEKLAKFLKFVSKGRTKKLMLNREDDEHLDYYELADSASYRAENEGKIVNLDNAGPGEFVSTDYIYAWFLRHPGIEEGHEFLLRGAWTSSSVLLLHKMIKLLFKKIQTEYMSPINITTKFYFTEVEEVQECAVAL